MVHKTVFTNGCFDILHIGHIHILREAKSFGDVLVVGLNSDESVKRLKGNNHPLITDQYRREILLELKCVDDVVIFNEDTPYELIKKVCPDIIVKGGDYTIEEVVGHDIVDKTIIVDFLYNISTSDIIKKAKKL